MAEIGAGGGSGYPGAIDTDASVEVNEGGVSPTLVRAEVINDLAAAIVATQTELGTDPAGAYTNVKTRLNNSGGGHITIFPWVTSSVTQGTWAIATNANQILNGAWSNSATASDADQVNYRAFMNVGTYTMVVVYIKTTSTGIIDIGIGGTSFGTKDAYAGSEADNQVWIVTGISIATEGFKTIYMKANGKNASSSAYTVYVSSISFFKTA